MAKTVTQAFEEFLSRMTPPPGQFQAASQHRKTIEHRLNASIGVARSFEIGSLQHGTGVNGRSDADYLFSLQGGRPSLSDTTLRRVREELNARFPSTHIHVARPAVVCAFAGGTETVEIVPGYKAAGDNYYIPAPGAEWLQTAPKKHLEYVNECNQTPPGKAKGLARLMKSWKYLNNVPASSFYLEMRAAERVSLKSTVEYARELSDLLNWLDSKQLPSMNDPKGAGSRINACSTEKYRQDALSKVHTGALRARRALDAQRAGKEEEAFRYLDQLFAYKFPSR